MDMLTISGLSKFFGKNRVIDKLNLCVSKHTVFGFIGRNGAGKTTTMKMILGLLKPDEGDISVNGQKVMYGQNETNQFIGYLPDVPEFYSFMTPKEYLRLCGQITNIPKDTLGNRINEVLHLVGLDGYDKRIRGFSRGMKQRLGVAQALLNRPQLLICDEPTSALDPLGRKEILDLLSNVREHTTIFFSTHILSDVERICDEVAFIDKGRIAACGSLEEIKSMRKDSGIEIEFFNQNDLELFLKIYSNAITLDKTRLQCSHCTQKDMVEIMQLLSQKGIAVQKIEMAEPTLEDLFMEVVRQ